MMKKTFTTTIYLVFVLVLLELGAFIVIKKKYSLFKSNDITNRELSGYYVYKNTPNYKSPFVHGTDNSQTPIITDAYGFIKDFDNYDRESNTFRIFLCGGSTMLSAGQTKSYNKIVDYPNELYVWDISIAGFLNKKLQEYYPSKNIQVINTAAFNRNMHQSYLLYLETISKLNPDLVISMDGYNDMSVLANNSIDLFNNYENKWLNKFALLNTLSNNKVKSNFLKLVLISTTRFEEKSSDSINHNKEKSICVNLDTTNYFIQEDSLWDIHYNTNRWIKSLVRFQNTAQFDSSSFMFVLQPILTSEINKPLSAKEQELYTYYSNINSSSSLKLCLSKEKYNLINDTLNLNWSSDDIVSIQNVPFHFTLNDLQRFQTKNYSDQLSNSIEANVTKFGGSYINMNKEVTYLDSSFELYTDYCHLTELGNSEIATIIAKRIKEDNLID